MTTNYPTSLEPPPFDAKGRSVAELTDEERAAYLAWLDRNREALEAFLIEKLGEAEMNQWTTDD